MVRLSVLFSTRNGTTVLRRTMDGYTRQTLSPALWKLVVVDNGSADETRCILDQYKDRLPLTVVSEPTPGKNRALNAGLSSLEGELIVISDDDAIPDDAFLDAWITAAAGAPDFQLLGGRITPVFDAPPPIWLESEIQAYTALYAARDLPEGPIEAGEIFGGNMAVRRQVFQAGQKFNEQIGPNTVDPNYPMGSETDFCVRMTRHGYKCWFSRVPHVQHIILEHQIETDYWWARAYRSGRGVARAHLNCMLISAPRKRPELFQTGRIIARRIRSLIRISSMLCFDQKQRFRAAWRYHYYRGYLDEYFKMRAHWPSHADQSAFPADCAPPGEVPATDFRMTGPRRNETS
jgi:glycosyltransferase involved in cell wall biosynthesis